MIATVLLIAMIVVIGLIVFVWFRNIIQEEGTKFGKNVNLVCGDVEFDTDYDSYSGTLSIANNGNVPIFGIKIKISGDGSHKTKDLKLYAFLFQEGKSSIPPKGSDVSIGKIAEYGKTKGLWKRP